MVTIWTSFLPRDASDWLFTSVF